MQSVITNKIDWENRVIYGASGRQYLIDPESISSARYIEFEIRSMTQAFKINLDGIMSTLTSIESHLTTGKLNTAGNIHNALNELQSFKTGLLDHEKFKRTESIEFCALFCTYSGEDLAVFTEAQIKEKWDDWKLIPNEDFFLLSLQVKIALSNHYRSLIESQKSDLMQPQEDLQINQ